MIFKTFDMERSVASQGYIEESYDMIVASNVLHATKPLEETLRNTRRLLKPGGFLLLLEVTSNEPLRNGLPMGGLPGWWIGADTGRPWGPTLSLPQWDSLLRKTGFSGIDTTTPDYDDAHPFSVFATQAVDDRVTLLRSPLSILPEATGVILEHLTVIGGKTLQTSRLVEGIIDLLTPHYTTITHLDSVEALNDVHLPKSSTVLSVTELDEPVLKSVSDPKLDCLKTLFTQARTMLWITRGCRAEEPYSNMMVGLARAIRFEYPNLNLQMFDVDKLDEGSPRLFSASLIRLQTIDTWKREKPLDDLLWSSEPEVAVEGGSWGKEMIPRLMTNQTQNDRYNSSRRPITRTVSPRTSTVDIACTESSYELRDSYRLHPWPRSNSISKVNIRVSYSVLQCIKIKSVGYLCLCLGSIMETGQPILALSETSASIIHVPKEWTVRCDSSVQPSAILLSVAGTLLAQYLTSITPMNGTLLVHEPDSFLVSALAKQAADRNIRLHCTSSKIGCQGSDWIYIHPNAPQRLIKGALPRNISLFMDLSVRRNIDNMGDRIAKCLPSPSKPGDRTMLFSERPMVRPDTSPAEVEKLFNAAWDDSRAANFAVGTANSVVTLPLENLPSHTTICESVSIVDWTTTLTVQAKIQPVDSEKLFRPDRTYLLAGLSGEVGQSLCQWMIDHGARYVVLTSRNPKVSKGWIESLEALGATVKALPL